MGRFSRRPGRRPRGRSSASLCSSLVLPILVALTAWLLPKTGRDYERRGRLSPEASAAGWTLYLAHAALTLSAARRSGAPSAAGKAPALALGGAVALLGSWLAADGVREFRSFEQMSGLKKGKLVTGGPYRYSRNPQVVGWGLVLLGAALAGRSAKAVLLIVYFFLVHWLYFAIEERHLERAFGGEYRRYRDRAPRFLGPPKDG